MLRLLKNVKQLSVSGVAGRGTMIASVNFGSYEPSRNKQVSLEFCYLIFFFKLNSLQKIEMRYELFNL